MATVFLLYPPGHTHLLPRIKWVIEELKRHGIQLGPSDRLEAYLADLLLVPHPTHPWQPKTQVEIDEVASCGLPMLVTLQARRR